ncbi:MAG: hypothetical protein CMA57_02285 [Euryarchaeota archaeon]|nr:hypothetical protein [Euryarchaeota archaeon]|tara:strand:+ start:5496 stop:6230 length:735 start_codon:yes stop_codon:yes gene_type:complete
MVDPVSAGVIVVAHGFWKVVDWAGKFVTHNVGIYGATEAGKTTLDQQLMTEGYVEPLDERHRTHHKKKWLSKHYHLPSSTTKRVRSEGLSKTLVSRDIGGHTQYMPMWIQDMYKRRIETLVIVIDHRHLEDRNNTDNQVAVGYIVDYLVKGKKPRGIGLISRFRARRWRPKRILILANKADLWLDEDGYSQWERGLISEHVIFEPFKESLYQLQKLHIPVRVEAMSATVGWNVEDALMRGFNDL